MRTEIAILAIMVTALTATDAAHAQTGTYPRNNPARSGYWPSFGYIPGGPYVYVPPAQRDGGCYQVRRIETPHGRRSREVHVCR